MGPATGNGKRVDLISPRNAFSEQLNGGPSDIVEDLRETVPWRADFPVRYALTAGDEASLVKVSFLMDIVEMTTVAEFIAEAVGERVELTEAFLISTGSQRVLTRKIMSGTRLSPMPGIRASGTEVVGERDHRRLY
jgi:hypothetical protein